jgi:hypothetical protein
MDIAPKVGMEETFDSERATREPELARGLWRMSTVVEMAEFVHLWDLVTQVTLGQEGDIFRWSWTALFF